MDKAIIRPQGLLRKNPYLGKNKLAHQIICEQHELPLDAKIILSVGYMDSRKGADLFVEIAAIVCRSLESCIFIWVGHADFLLEQSIKERIKELKLEKRIILTGYNPEPFMYYAAASVYALTSREDPYPNVVLESANVGVPVVAFTNTTGIAEFILQQKGALVDYPNVDNFARKIEELLNQPLSLSVFPLPELSFQKYTLDILYHLSGFIRVSVIVPNYNYAEVIKNRLDSIRSQTYPIYEVIILDDASTDNSVTTIKDYCVKNEFEMSLSVNETNSGSVFRQWVKGVQQATGDLVWIAEADDVANPHFLATLVNAFSKKGIVMSFCQSRQVTENGVILADNYLDYTDDIDHRWHEDYFGAGIREVREALSIKNVIPNVSAVLFRRIALLQALEELGSDLFEFKIAGDWLVFIHVLLQGDMYYSAKSLNDHCRHSKSVTTSIIKETHLSEVKRAQIIAQKKSDPNEKIIVQAKNYIERLTDQFGLSRA